MQRADSRRPMAEVVPRLKRHRFDASRMRRHRQQQIDVRSPAIALDQRFVADGTHRVTNHGHPEQAEAAERVIHTGHLGETARQPLSNALKPTNGLRRAAIHGGFADNNVRSALEALHQVGDLFRLVGKVTLHQDYRVSPGVPATIQRSPQQLIDCAGIPDVLCAAQNGDGQGIRIRRQDLGRGIGTPVVVNEELVLAREVGEHLADAPKHQPCGRGLVMDGNADV